MQLVVNEISIWRAFVQQTLDRITKEEIKVNGPKIISEKELKEDVHELRLEDVQESPLHLQDYQHEVQDLLEEVNLIKRQG